MRRVSVTSVSVLLLLLSCSHKSTEPQQHDEVRTYVYAGAYTSGSGDFRVFKIDTERQEVVDSAVLGEGAYDMVCSPDGRLIWLVGSEWGAGTRVYSTSTWQIVKTLPTYIEPVYTKKGVVGFSRSQGVMYLDESLNVRDVDTTTKLYNTVEMPDGKRVIGAVDGSGQVPLYQFYDYLNRQPGDTTRLVDLRGIGVWIKAVSPDGRLFGMNYYGMGYGHWLAFDQSGNLLAEEAAMTPGDVILTDDRVFITDPGEERGTPSRGYVYVYDLNSYCQVGKIGWSGYRDPSQPPYIDMLATNRGVYVPSTGEVFLTYGGIPGPLIVIDENELTIKKTYFPQSEEYYFDLLVVTEGL
jgi:hypothetical protein